MLWNPSTYRRSDTITFGTFAKAFFTTILLASAALDMAQALWRLILTI